MANYTLILDYAQRGAAPPESIDLRLVKRIIFCEDGRSFKIQLDKRELSLAADSKRSLEPWKSLLEVYNERAKPWSPIPIPVSFHRSISKCVEFMLRPSMASEEEGIFRVSASSTDIQDLFTLLMTSKKDIPVDADCHVVGGCLKKLLRDLPETLLTKKLYLFLTQSSPTPVETEVAESISSLPPANRDLLLSLFKLLVLIATSKPKTKMDMSGLEICILPTLGLKEKSVIENMRDSLEPLFNHYEKLLGYPGDYCNKFVTRQRVISQTSDVPVPAIPQELKDDRGGLPDTNINLLPTDPSPMPQNSRLPPKKLPKKLPKKKKKTALPPKKKRGQQTGSSEVHVSAHSRTHVHIPKTDSSVSLTEINVMSSTADDDGGSDVDVDVAIMSSSPLPPGFTETSL